MRCQDCRQNEAEMHIVKLAEGQKTELSLCRQCARARDELDFFFEPEFSLHELFAGLLKQGFLQGHEGRGATRLQCRECGLTFAQFSQVGRLGCARCLFAFEDRLRPLLRRIHGGETHSGKVPARFAGRVWIRRELDQLREELQQKVEKEEFEAAAALRDRIRSMEQSMVEEADADSGHGESGSER